MRRDIHIFLDGPNSSDLEAHFEYCDGTTFNPTLFSKLGVVDYLAQCKFLGENYGSKPLSLEVVADDEDNMIRQAKLLSEIGENIWVKIPISFSNGQTTSSVLTHLSECGIKLNVTAVFTLEQCRTIEQAVEPGFGANLVVSVFAGRLFDIGIDAKSLMEEIVSWNKQNLGAQILWASPRQSYDVILANQVSCDIITVPPTMFSKLEMVGKSPIDYSRETVEMFVNDAKKSNYQF